MVPHHQFNTWNDSSFRFICQPLVYSVGLLDVLCALAPNALVNTGDKVVAALWAYYHSPPLEDGMLSAKDLLKAFRAVKWVGCESATMGARRRWSASMNTTCKLYCVYESSHLLAADMDGMTQRTPLHAA
jgi:hypothetical protein